MPLIETEPGVLLRTFEQLRRCGAGRNECVVYWTGPKDAPRQVDRIEHPAHASSASGYVVDGLWVNAFFSRLRREQRQTRVQVHTHPALAGHSRTDDEFALVPTTGFVSLVIPRFAMGQVSLEDAWLGRLDERCGWRRVSLTELKAP
jgi:hypothetical protein